MDFKVIFKDTFLADLERIVRLIAASEILQGVLPCAAWITNRGGTALLGWPPGFGSEPLAPLSSQVSGFRIYPLSPIVLRSRGPDFCFLLLRLLISAFSFQLLTWSCSPAVLFFPRPHYPQVGRGVGQE
jgi:hypothetical protein